MEHSELSFDPHSVGAERDQELMRRLRVDDTGALDELMTLYWEDLVRYSWSIVDSVDDAEDFAQQAFFQLWRRRRELEHRGAGIRSYLLRIVRNLSLNERRHRSVIEKVGPRLRETAPCPPTPAEAIEEEELRAAVQAALDALPPRRREVYTLIRFHGLSYREAAEVMGISPQTVANQLSTALAELRRSLRDYLTADDPALERR